ncbi:MAG: VCBS repeat-containing protein [Planctomycetaceae bacterium]|nr:VCBS repeat-containing protein [Planctomycetaceae bacterium]
MSESTRSGRTRVSLPVVGVVILLGIATVVAALTGLGRRDAGPGRVNSVTIDESAEVVDDQALALPEAQAKYLQDAEHLGGFVFGDLTLPLVSDAIRQSDPEALQSFLSSEFRGEVFSDNGGRGAALGVADVHTWKTPRDMVMPVDRESFTRSLLAWRAEFSKLETASLKVMLMRPETRGSFDGPWVGSLKLRLAGTRDDGRIGERVVRFRCRLTSLTEDQPQRKGWLSECLAYEARSSHSQQRLLEPMQESTGIDVARLHDNWKRKDKKNLPFLTGGTYLVDYDRDGVLDVMVTDLTGVSLYHGEGAGRFSNVTLAAGLPPLSAPNEPPAIGAVFADFDNDGFPDLLLGPRLYRNVEGVRFEPLIVARDTSLELAKDASQYAVADFDRDGLLDLFVVGLASGSPRGQPWIGKAEGIKSQLWRNKGGWQFEDVTERSGTVGQGGPTFAAVWFDANQDGWPDLMTSCETGKNDYLINQQDGTFRQAKLPDIYGGFSMGITAGDIDNDGRPDIYVANMYSKAGERIVDNLQRGAYPDDIDAQMRDFVSGNELYHNLGEGRFERVGQATGVADVGWAYGPGFVDLDNDGWLDLYAPVGFQSVTPERPDG